MLSRETAFMFNNLLFATFTFTVLLGTMFPLVVEAFTNEKVSVGAPFFNQMTVPLCVALLFLLGVGPMLPWRAARTDQLRRESVPPIAAFFVTLVLALIFHVRSIYGVLAFAFTGFALVANVQQFAMAAAARRRATGANPVGALWGAMNANPRRYGGYIAHIGVIIIALGITASSVFRTESEATLRVGEAMRIGEYSVRFDSLFASREPHRDIVGAVMSVTVNGKKLGVLEPRLNWYVSEGGNTTPTPGVRSSFRNDLYLVLKEYSAPTSAQGQTASISAIVEPWVSWIWFGALVIASGAVFGAVKRRGDRPLDPDAGAGIA
ncbi:MAG: cytochrome c-type biogenesis CcmF C-terminal domain-containing protein, partial [Longimicrobiales bacterium]